MFFSVSDKNIFYNCGPREEIEKLAKFIKAGSCLELP